MTAPARLSRRLSYGAGSVGTGIFTTVPGVLLLYFLTVEVHLSAAVAGMIILIPKAAGLIGDPLIGIWADRLHRSSHGGRRRLMALGALVGCVGLWMLFSLPQQHAGNVAVPVLIYLVCTTGYSLFAVPYSALPAELDARPAERRALVSTRLGLAFLGVLIGGVSAPVIATRAGYDSMGLAMAIACAIAMAAFLITCRLPAGGMARSRPAPAARTARQAAWRLPRRFVVQMAAFILLLAAAGAFSALLPFLVRELGADGEVVGLAMLVDILAALGSSAVWPSVIRRLGLRRVWWLAAAIGCVSGVMVGTASAIDAPFYVGMALGGASMAGVQIAGFTGLADLTADYLEQGEGGGLITGIWMAGEKPASPAGRCSQASGSTFCPRSSRARRQGFRWRSFPACWRCSRSWSSRYPAPATTTAPRRPRRKHNHKYI